MKSTKLIFGMLFLLLASFTSIGAKTDITINNNWQFHKGELKNIDQSESITWETVNLPHCYNNQDIYDDESGYYRGETWYRKQLKFPLSGHNYFLHFEGVNQEAEIYVNNQLAGTHKGGYTGFTIPISSFLKEDGNTILVKVNNRFNEDIPTLSADFSFLGGIYRDVHLITSQSAHFAFNQYGSSGIYLTTPEVSEETAKVRVKAVLQNESGKMQEVQLEVTIKDAAGLVVSEYIHAINLYADVTEEISVAMPELKKPNLWSPDSPYLYHVDCSIKLAGSDEELDAVSSSLGLRWYKFDAANGFFLNGKHCKLIGTNRHQDYQGLGNALPDALHENDVRLLKQMGGNFLRVAHYPQDPRVLEVCDKIGIITSVEIPIVNYITESEGFYTNCKEMMKEMIHQDYNHPSVVIWAYMNEVLLKDIFSGQPERRKKYIKYLHQLASDLEAIARSLDTERYTMIPNHGAFDKYNDAGLTEIPMIVGWNLYLGWYGADINGFQKFLDLHHEVLPHKPMIVTEYGAGADPRLRSVSPERFDFTLEYEQFYHQHYLTEIMKRDFVAGANVWNLADFSSESRIDAVPHINNKGLLSYDRRPKDAYLFYQAALLKEPFVAIGSKITPFRSAIADRNNEEASSTKIEVYSNQPKVELYQNGISLGIKSIVDFKASWDVPFVNGVNLLEAKASNEVKDFHRINFTIQPRIVSNFNVNQKLCVSLGDRREFWDELTNEVWIPSKEYSEGSWGTIGGEAYNQDNGKSYGADCEIFRTPNDPIFQTQLMNIDGFKADVPAGKYELTLHFAEIILPKDKETSAYEIGMANKNTNQTSQRVFNVYINNELVVDHLNIAENYGAANAISFKFPVAIKNDALNIRFEAIKGQAVLNALELRREY